MDTRTNLLWKQQCYFLAKEVFFLNFVGIDISKFKHDCAVVGSDGEVLVASFSFNNDCDGFASLLSLLSNLDLQCKCNT